MGLFKKSKSKPSKSSRTPSTATASPPALTHRANASTSNLSTTSTLYETPSQAKRPSPPPRSSSYEAFLHHARLDEESRISRENAARERIERAWRAATERRRESRAWPADPWRGGFGPPSQRGVGICAEANERVLGPRIEEAETGVRGWLVGNGLVGRTK